MRRRVATGVGIVTAGVMALPGVAQADPEPTQQEVQDEIDRLTEESSELVDAANEAEEEREAAEAELEDVEERIETETEDYERLRQRIGELAGAAYQGGDLGSTVAVLGSGDPQDVVDQAATLEYISQNRQAELEQYSAAAERLEELRAEAEAALEDAEQAETEAQEAAEEVETALAEQQDLLESFPEVTPSGSAGGTTTGGSYTGSASGSAGAALDYAYAQLGDPYVWGGTGPDGFDCSGLTMMAWQAGGVSLPRTSQAQFSVGQPVDRSSLQPGDLLFFYGGISHVGLYVGDGQMIHAPNSSSTVQVVSLAGYWDGQFQGARRP
ncbi:NlpC/P60 family protein [Allonocardiopsis opalescens]|uniref:Cell wall-associated NlpC family hydrolase n=1 Tax=Allonocardiopsis opalescens TaxID=1144618 RepID=A0A2T0PZQ8_9ACTN|nr:NlpC/P60 family protein [Allonocardiopsis opalescens]PRX97030.1 cell wall-associated NlpC family hydrolase [Allonocardiopsis opalescens]